MGMVAILVMWPRPFEQTFVPPSWRVSIWNLSSIRPVVSEEKMFEIVDGRTRDDRRGTTDGRRSDWYIISSPMSLKKTLFFLNFTS